ncbi:MAG: hypothetical protein CVV13_05255 [Gammaproteobacteria bacterium HGW-Gammaproteobacteria-3]|jgi:hypothetical protein|nr:MAG: hypothetical protein CVV13_05255 [Gammaproteobacteria bacterium HGW-Gammaproteobacteria-3]
MSYKNLAIILMLMLVAAPFAEAFAHCTGRAGHFSTKPAKFDQASSCKTRLSSADTGQTTPSTQDFCFPGSLCFQHSCTGDIAASIACAFALPAGIYPFVKNHTVHSHLLTPEVKPPIFVA